MYWFWKALSSQLNFHWVKRFSFWELSLFLLLQFWIDYRNYIILGRFIAAESAMDNSLEGSLVVYSHLIVAFQSLNQTLMAVCQCGHVVGRGSAVSIINWATFFQDSILLTSFVKSLLSFNDQSPSREEYCVKVSPAHWYWVPWPWDTLPTSSLIANTNQLGFCT